MEFKAKTALFNIQIIWDDMSKCYSVRFTSMNGNFADKFTIDIEYALKEMAKAHFKGYDIPESAGQ